MKNGFSKIQTPMELAEFEIKLAEFINDLLELANADFELVDLEICRDEDGQIDILSLAHEVRKDKGTPICKN